MKDFESPSLYIDWGFYFMVAACLQRRVWWGIDQDPLYANNFIVLVGDPATGKGRVIRQISSCIKSFKINPKDASNEKISNLIIPVAPDSTTLERLTQAMTECSRPVKIGEDDRGRPKIYLHASLAFLLEEFSTLLRKDCEDLVRFLMVVWDCANYSRETKNSGCDIIYNSCMSILAGIQPKTLSDYFDKSFIEAGFSSRTIFVYAPGPRFRLFDFTISKEQLEARATMLKHFESLTKLYGKVSFTPEAQEFIKHWYEKRMDVERHNLASQLDHYYGRKKVHLIKLSMLVHFSDNLVGDITKAEVETALIFLNLTESSMHKALRISGKQYNNPLADAQDAIDSYISKNAEADGHEYGVPLEELLLEFQVRQVDLLEIINTLKMTGKISSNIVNNRTYVSPVKKEETV